MRIDPASPVQWTALLLIGASGILLLYNTLPVALAYPRAGTTALVLFSLFAIPFWWLRGRVADRLALPAASLAIGLVWGAIAYRYMPEFFWWLTPVLAGLVLSIPLSILSSRPDIGRAARALGLFLIPEEIDPPQVLARLPRLRTQLHAPPERGSGLERLLRDDRARQIHLDLLPEPAQDDPLHRHHLTGLRLKARLRGVDALTRKERMEVMLDRFTLEALAHELGAEEQPAGEGDAVPLLTALRPSL